MNSLVLKIRNEYTTNKQAALAQLSFICFTGIIMLPLIIGVFYALPAADDFSHAIDMRKILQNYNMFTAACMKTKETYMTWQGTYTSTFLVAALEPLGTVGLTGLRILLCINVLFLVFGVLECGTIIAEKMFGLCEKGSVYLLLGVFLFITFGICRGGQEIFYWYTGACVYTLPMSLTFCCLVFYAKCLWGNKTAKSKVLLCVLAFLASGGVLQVTAILCYGMLILWAIYLFMHRDRNGIMAGIPFMAAFIGALINAFAPGNFVRHTYIEEGVHVFKAIKNILKIMVTQVRGVLTENLFLYMIVFCFIFGIFIASKSAIKVREYHPVLLFIILAIGLMISIFPFCLGVGTSNMSALRNIYICDLYIGWGSAIWAFEFGNWFGFKRGYKINREGILLTSLCIGLIFFRTGDIWKFLHDGASGGTFYELCSGDMRRCSIEWEALLQVIENDKESEVVVQANKIPDSILKTPGITNDKTHWVNVAAAQYYNKETVSVTFEEME